MKNINIPEPCSEDWSGMTPNEKGAFCQKCALDVYDFTNKSADEIREALTLNIASPVCMRIKSTQLGKLNDDFSAWKMNNKHSYQRAWVFTLLVVFGMTLFSCEEDEKPVVEKFQKIGQTILNQEDEKKVTDPLEPVNAEVQVIQSDEGQSEPKEKTKIECDIDKVEPETMIFGKVSSEHTVVPEEAFRVSSAIREVHMTAGIPAMSSEYNLYLQDTFDGVVDSIELTVESKITGLVYPNPASNQTTLQLNMPSRGKGEIELFSLSGQKIRTIHSGRLKKGESEFSLDLTGLETGLYLVIICSGKMKETVKFTKV